MDCIFCKHIFDENLIFETKHFQVFLTSNQTYLGRCCAALKRHAGSLSELSKEEWEDFTKLVKVIEEALKSSFGADVINWSCLTNNAYQNNPPNPHVHWHIVPRYSKDVNFEGILFQDKEFGHRYDSNKKNELSKDINEKVIRRIKNLVKIY